MDSTQIQSREVKKQNRKLTYQIGIAIYFMIRCRKYESFRLLNFDADGFAICIKLQDGRTRAFFIQAFDTGRDAIDTNSFKNSNLFGPAVCWNSYRRTVEKVKSLDPNFPVDHHLVIWMTNQSLKSEDPHIKSIGTEQTDELLSFLLGDHVFLLSPEVLKYCALDEKDKSEFLNRSILSINHPDKNTIKDELWALFSPWDQITDQSSTEFEQEPYLIKEELCPSQNKVKNIYAILLQKFKRFCSENDKTWLTNEKFNSWLTIRSYKTFETSSSAGIKGPLYEIRLSLLFMIRALLRGYQFELACNLDEKIVGKFDDIVLLFKPKNSPWRCLVVQTKNTGQTPITLDSLTTMNRQSNFEVYKYLKSFKMIIESIKNRKFPQPFDTKDLRTLLLTTQPLQENTKKKSEEQEQENKYFEHYARENEYCEIFDLKGDQYQLKKEIIKECSDKEEIYSHVKFREDVKRALEEKDHEVLVKEIKKSLGKLGRDEQKMAIVEEEFAEFLKTFVFAVRQPDHDKLVQTIKEELKELILFSKVDVNDVYDKLHGKLLMWYMKEETKCWITADKFSKWIAKASGLNVQLINPVEPSKDRNIKWSTLQEKTKAHLLSKTVKFQDALVCLGDLRPFRDPYTYTPLGDLNENLLKELAQSTDLRFGRKPSSGSYNERYYIERIVQVASFDKDKLKSLESNPHFSYIQCWNKHYFNPSKIDASFLQEVRRCVDPHTLIEMAEEKFLCEHYRIVVISGVAGMGKSTILPNFYCRLKKLHPDWWIFIIDLNSEGVRTYLDDETFEVTLDEDLLTRFMSNVLNVEKSIETFVLKHRMNVSGGVVFMLDGFDEINGERQMKVVKLSKALLASKVDQLYITTRSHRKETELLENELKVLPFQFRPFSKEDQIDFLIKYWAFANTADSSGTDFKQEASKLVDKLADLIKNGRGDGFPGIPLQCRMLADAFYDTKTKTVQVPEKLELVTLYQKFIDKKMAIFFSEKERNRQDAVTNKVARADFEHFYKRKATELIFPEAEILWAEPYKGSLTSEDLLKVGLTFVYGSTDSDHKFIHRTFAEFFAAKHLSEIWKTANNEQIEYFSKRICRNESFLVSLRFMNHFIGESFKDPFPKDLVFSCESILSLLMICDAGLENVAKLTYSHFQKKKESEPFEGGRQLSQDLYFRERFEGNDDAAELETFISKMLFAKDETGRSVLHLAADSGLFVCTQYADSHPLYLTAKQEKGRMIEYIFNLGRKIKNVSELRFLKDVCGKTALHYAAEHGQAVVGRLILEIANCKNKVDEILFSKDKSGKTALHYEAEHGQGYVSIYILDHAVMKNILGEILSSKDESGKTALHYAAELGQEDVCELILSFARIIGMGAGIMLLRDNSGKSPKDYAVGHANIAKMFEDFAQEID